MKHVGVDILNISRIRALEGAWDDPFFTKTFTPVERAYCLAAAQPVLAFAEAFAAKEAVFKSLGMSGNDVRLDQIEIRRNEIGQPVVTLLPPLSEKTAAAGIARIHLSLSSETELVTAFAVSE